MKKLFFFRSYSSDTENNPISLSDDKDESKGKARDKEHKDLHGTQVKHVKPTKHTYGAVGNDASSALRRSQSLSSKAFFDGGLARANSSCTSSRSRSPCSSTSSGSHPCRHASGLPHTPKRIMNGNLFGAEATIRKTHGSKKLSSGYAVSHNSSSTDSSSNISSNVLDRYIDGEEFQERQSHRFRCKKSSNEKSPRRLPPASPNFKESPRCHSFREGRNQCFDASMEKRYTDSPGKVARNVLAKLSEMNDLQKQSSEELNHDFPITLEDVYMGGSSNNNADLKSDSFSEEAFDGFGRDEFLGLQKQMTSSFSEEDDPVLLELKRRSKEAEERVVVLSEELEQENSVGVGAFDGPPLMQAVKSLKEDKISLAVEILGLLKSRITERENAYQEVRSAKVELEGQTLKLQKENCQLQTALEKELDRRSSGWSAKMEKYRMEEERLRDRIRELAEQNVALQRKISSFNDKETESRTTISHSETQLKRLNSRVEELSQENNDLKQKLLVLQDKNAASEEDLGCISKSFEQRENDCKELEKAVSRLLRTCNDQEKTIEGLRDGLSKEVDARSPDDCVAKLRAEQMRLTGTELGLRRELESVRVEAESLRRENIDLLTRLKGGSRGQSEAYKLDNELSGRVSYLQNQTLALMNEGTRLCLKLLDHAKTKRLDEQFLVECEVKVQGFKRGVESLKKSLQLVSSLLQEKSSSVAQSLEALPSGMEEKAEYSTQARECNLKHELKAETLLTRLLRDELYSKELEVEQLRAEVAAAVRGNDILRCESQIVSDSLACATHKLKDVELQMMNKEDSIGQLQRELQETIKELKVIKGILPNVTRERDLLWGEVQQYTEKNMLLNNEVALLKKKIESLEEETLLKEGQITILKDAVNNRSFSLLSGPISGREFLLD